MYKDNCLSDVEMYFKTLIRYSVIKNECRGTHFEELLKSFIANCVLLLLLYEIKRISGNQLTFCSSATTMNVRWTFSQKFWAHRYILQYFAVFFTMFASVYFNKMSGPCTRNANIMMLPHHISLYTFIFEMWPAFTHRSVCCAFTTHTSSVIVSHVNIKYFLHIRTRSP